MGCATTQWAYIPGGGAKISRREHKPAGEHTLCLYKAKASHDGIMCQNAPAWVWFAGENGTPEALPKTASGKVMKHLLREWSRDLAKKDVGRSLSF
jgi:hypothetical protein